MSTIVYLWCMHEMPMRYNPYISSNIADFTNLDHV